MDISKPLGSLGNLTSAFKINSPTIDSKDIDSLTKSIDNLTKILNKRTGKVKKSSESTIDKEDKQGNLFTDIKDFGKGFISPFADAKKYIFGGKNTMPPGIDLKTNEDAEKSDNKVLTLSQFKNELVKMRNTDLEKNLLAEVVVIRKIVAQKAGYGDKAALSGTGIEPNNEEDKQKDRELLAEAIANKLKGLVDNNSGGGIISSILEGLGLSKLFGKTPKVPGGGKVPPVPGGGKAPPVPGKMGLLGGRLLGPASLALGAYEASEFLGETGYGDNMSKGAGKAAEKAFRENVAPTIDPVKTGTTPEQARNALGGSNRDIEKLGGREALLKIANTDFESSGSSKDLKEQIRIKEQTLKTSGSMLNTESRDKLQTDIDTLKNRMPTADMPDQMAAETARLNRYANIETKQSPDTANRMPAADMSDQSAAETARLNRYSNIETKQNPDTAEKLNQPTTFQEKLNNDIMKEMTKQLQASSTGDLRNNILKELENENSDLKNSAQSESQILAPIISNRTIDNSTQTFLTSPPKPYSNSDTVNRWQARTDGKL